MLSSTSSWANDIDKKRLDKGQKAPFAGVLLTNGALAKIISDFELKIADLELKLKKAETTNHLILPNQRKKYGHKLI